MTCFAGVGTTDRYAGRMSPQIAVKLTDELLRAVDELVTSGDARNRSDAVRRGLQRLLEERRRHEVDRAFAAGFARLPETEQELADARRSASEAIAEEPWEPWW